MIGTWLLCAKCKIKVNAFNTYNWWLVHDCYTRNARLKLMYLVHRINDWYMIVIREMHVSVVAWSLYHLQDFCCTTVRIHNFVFQSSRFLLDFRILLNLQSIILQLWELQLGQRSRISNAFLSIDLESSFGSVICSLHPRIDL